MKRLNVDVAVGLLLVLGFAAFTYLAVRLGDLPWLQHSTYTLTADFTSVSGLKVGASVETAGVPIGKVVAIDLDPQSYDATVHLAVDAAVRLPADSIASVRTAGIIGDRYLDIAPGGAEEMLAAGGTIEETEASINLEQLISKYIFEKKE